MTQNSLSTIASTPVVGLGTQTYNVPTTGLYTAACEFTIPYQASGGLGDSTTTSGGSSLQILVQLNGSTKLTLGSPSPYQATAGDTITFVLSSAAAVDNLSNAIKGVCNVFQGPL